jgi:hypothetical protein
LGEGAPQGAGWGGSGLPSVLCRSAFGDASAVERLEQRPRLRDLQHFPSRRKAFERGREDRAGVGGAVGRPVKSGESESGEEFVGPGALLLCYGESGVKRVFRGGRPVSQDFTANR